MSFRFTAPAGFNKKRRSKGNLRLLNMLEKYISDTEAVPITFLTRFWADQAATLTYKEIRKMIESGEVTSEELENWRKDYSKLVDSKMADLWTDAVVVGQIGNMIMENLKNSNFQFDPGAEGVQRWIRERGASFVTNSVEEQKKAIMHLTEKAIREELSPDELARVIRPCVGLNTRQAKANLNYYKTVKEQLKKDHPRMSEETIVRRAKEKALKYAEKQHRYRAQTIAQNELAEAYNNGAHLGIKQAQENGYIGHVRKVWVTAREFLYGSGKNRVCQSCEPVEAIEKEMDEYFEVPKFGPKLIPPAHPRCRCIVKYIEVKGGT